MWYVDCAAYCIGPAHSGCHVVATHLCFDSEQSIVTSSFARCLTQNEVILCTRSDLHDLHMLLAIRVTRKPTDGVS